MGNVGLVRFQEREGVVNLRKTLVVTCIMSFLALGPCGAMAATLNVPSSAFPDIQTAVEHGSDGDVINVAPGRYVENLLVENDNSATTPSLALRASGQATIRGSVTVVGTSIEMDGFRIVPAKTTNNGIILRGAQNSKITNCVITGFQGTGILIEAGTVGIIIEHNAIHRCGTAVGCLAGEAAAVNYVAGAADNVRINYSSIAGNMNHGVNNMNGQGVDATLNWWGDSSGPGGVGQGTGDSVTANVDYSDWDMASEPPNIVITRAYVTGLSYRYTSYKGDTVQYVIEYSVSGGGEYAKHRVEVKALPDFGSRCSKEQNTVGCSTFVGQGNHTMILTKKTPRCADDYTSADYSVGHFEMEGNWVDVLYKVILKDPYGEKVAGDTSAQAQVFLVKKDRDQ
jgi:hypothetical protein